MTRLVSRFEGVSRKHALGVLIAVVLLMLGGIVLGVAAPLKGFENVPTANGEGDAVLYKSITDRVRAGEDYYSVAADELRTRGYALKPALNFRLPTLAVVQGSLPSDLAARLMLAAITWVAFCVWGVRLLRMQLRPIVLTLILLAIASGSFLGLITTGLCWHELWAGLFVMISLGLYGPRTWWLSAIFALCAILIRELALPLPVIMGALALYDRRWREAATWLAVIVIFGAVLGLHLNAAAQHIRSDDPANTWSAFGGWNFIISTAKWNYLLAASPEWIRAISVPLALLGLAGWKDVTGLRATLLMLAWTAAFMVVGRADNHYWGLIYSPLIAIGLALAPFSLIALIRAASRQPAAAT